MEDTLSPEEITHQLHRILADALFERSQRLGGFLRFAVEESLAGRGSDLKEYTVGTRVLERSENFRPQEDPVVRIMAGRLRAKLAEYYGGSGAADPVLIELPRGGYATRFSRRIGQAAPRASRAPVTRRRSVGREAEIRRLHEAFAALAGGGRIVTVSGEAGMGKTTFVEDFLTTISGGGALAARGGCSERLGESDAFAPLLDALDGLQRTGGHAAQLLASVAPTWHGQVTGLTQDKAPSHERLRRELAAFLEQLAHTHPVILFLDDLHWADASTCDLLAYLGQRLQSVPLLILGTYRPGAVLVPGNPFLRTKLRWERTGACEEIALAFLTRVDVDDYLALRFPAHSFPAVLGTVLQERTEGQPLFLTDLVDHLLSTGVVAQQNGHWGLTRGAAEVRLVIPAGTHAMIGVKLEQVTEADREILLTAAVQGMQFDSAVIAEVLHLDPALVEDRLRKLDRIHHLVSMMEEHDQPGRTVSVRYRFVHVYYQNALYSALTPSRRAADSLAVAGVLAAMAGDDASAMAPELAVLFETGRDPGSAAEYFLSAARRAARVFAYPEVVLLCERGLCSLAALPDSRPRDQQELHYSITLGMALMATRGYAAPEVERTHRRSRELCLKLNEVGRLVSVLWSIHTCETNGGRLVEARRTALEMRQAAATLQHPDADLASLHALGTTYAFSGRLPDARRALESILSLPPTPQRQIFVLDPLVTSLCMLARLLTLMGEGNEALLRADEALEKANRLAHPHTIAYATFWQGWIRHLQGWNAESLEHLDGAMAQGRAHGAPLIVEWARVVRGSALAHLGRVEEGLAEIRLSIERQEKMGSRLERAYCLTLLAEALLRDGQASQALEVAHQALELGQRTEGRCYEPETFRILAEATLADFGATGRAQAEEHFTNALKVARDTECTLLELRAATSHYRARIAAGDSSVSRPGLESVLARFRPAEAPVAAEARLLLGHQGAGTAVAG